ncbi:MAG TPA: hypothetical protein EYP62_02115, partial [Kiritimatiellae bacterium]|nr:hypothetical protein [Kiritimatiellia bacterium]
MKVRNRWLAIAAVMSLAAVLRFAWLGRASYTIDESQLVKIALSYRSISDLVQREFQRFAFLHRLPLTMILLRLCAQTVPWQGPLPPEWVMRLPMALIGLATVGLLYAARLLGDRRVGFWAMLLCAVSFFAVFYSREAYDYSLLIFLSTATLLAAAALLKSTLLNPTRFPVVTA